jgi:hypothetical protein
MAIGLNYNAESVARHESSKGVDFGYIHDYAHRKASERAIQIEKVIAVTDSARSDR